MKISKIKAIEFRPNQMTISYTYNGKKTIFKHKNFCNKINIENLKRTKKIIEIKKEKIKDVKELVKSTGVKLTKKIK